MSDIRTPHTCHSQCDSCHTLDNCVPATRRHGELLLCDACYPDPHCLTCSHKVRLHSHRNGCALCLCGRAVTA